MTICYIALMLSSSQTYTAFVGGGRGGDDALQCPTWNIPTCSEIRWNRKEWQVWGGIRGQKAGGDLPYQCPFWETDFFVNEFAKMALRSGVFLQ